MKNFKKLLVLGAALMATVTLPMNWGGRIGKLGTKFAGRAKTAAQNVRANPFPVFCKAVSAGVGAFYCGVQVPGIIEQIRTKQYTPEGYSSVQLASGHASKANESVTAFVRSYIDLPNAQEILVLVDMRDAAKAFEIMDAERNLTCVSVLSRFQINMGAVYDHTILIPAPTCAFLLSPHIFMNYAEYKKFCAIIGAIVQHEAGHLKKNHSMQRAVIAPLIAPFIVGAMGKRMGPLAHRLSRMRFKAVSEDEMFVDAVYGGMLKCMATATGLTLLERHNEYEADSNVAMSNREALVRFLYYRSKDAWTGATYNPNLNLDFLLLRCSHPHTVNRIKRSFGIEKLAESVMRDGVVFDPHVKLTSYRLLKEEQEKMALCDTPIKKCEFAKNKLRSQGVIMMFIWPGSLLAKFESYHQQINDAITQVESSPEWQAAKESVVKDMEQAVSVPRNILRLWKKALG